MTTTNKFLKSVKAHQESKKEEKFSGTLSDYLELLEANSDIAALAHKRLYHQILGEGLTVLDETDER